MGAALPRSQEVRFADIIFLAGAVLTRPGMQPFWPGPVSYTFRIGRVILMLTMPPAPDSDS